jgi:hypothetical protein
MREFIKQKGIVIEKENKFYISWTGTFINDDGFSKSRKLINHTH